MQENYLKAIEASIKAGDAIMEIYREDFDVEYKDDASPLTQADKHANAVIMSYLERTSIPIISEENKQTDYAERKSWTQCWIVDPLDGTKEFVKKNGEFTVNIALINEQKPVFGVIYVPAQRLLYVGDVDAGQAFKVAVPENDTDLQSLLNRATALQPSRNSSPIRVVGSRSHMNQDTLDHVETLKKEHQKPIEIVSKGSSLKFCLVAEGQADVYPRYAPTMEWDTAAGQAICKAVGLEVTSLDTQEEMLYNRENLLNGYFHVKTEL
ncbi:3'(2'),5'-bisphosphate nucleotidase CysQ [Psychroflexus sp. YR1-1]|uniref:3'(2'),5'-bisphosphate nucleotidase CysQ n=1 Tax=Psychroflexus aurantiacus TaxID=2709310 RepID=A0A6B3RAD6_9FLAO|nr:3'(2'),5'-bisphosphate nucleotidase CysQ [Psychroflexus aurantiacus]NEV94464.1 3'(2'),5'-bisphosphate nucleotidase CysQ [Psychroflexus aurantiacus]